MGQRAYDVRPTNTLFMKIVVGLITTQLSIQVELGDLMPVGPYWKMNKTYFDQVEGQVATIWKLYIYIYIYIYSLNA
jgi:hypothetical protein